MDYLHWNDGVAARFFNPKVAHRRVFMNVTPEVISEVGKPENLHLQDFVRVARIGPAWSFHGDSLCERALEVLANWRRRRLDFPPYIGFLAIFVLAAGIGDEGEFASQAYYPRLRKLLGEEESDGPYPHFHEMRSLWSDLESWSHRDRGGELGLFEYPATGRLVNVGLPISQAILTDQERHALPLIFSDAGFDAGADVPDPLLVRVLSDFGDGRLRPRTLRILGDTPANREHFDVLLAAVHDEALRWDGTVSGSRESGSKRSFTHAGLRICCEELDRTALTVSLRLRCQVRREFPEDGLTFTGEHHTIYSCEEFAGGWSTPLCEKDSGVPADASGIDILEGVSLRDSSHGWRSSLLRAGVRVLVSGAGEGLPGYIEILQLPPNSPFLLIAHASAWDLIERWGSSCCEGFQKLDISRGLPAQCRLYSADKAKEDRIVRDVYPNLALPAGSQLRLRGGIRLMGNTYFTFALPRILVETVSTNFQVYCNGHLLLPSVNGEFTLMGRSPKASRFEIQLKEGSETLAEKSVFCAADFPWQGLQHRVWFDLLGNVTKPSSVPRTSAATVIGTTIPQFSDWVRRTDLTSPCESVDGSDVGAEPPSMALPNVTEVASLVSEWAKGFSAMPPVFLDNCRLLNRKGGDLLNEGVKHYYFGFQTGSPGRFARAIQAFVQILDDSPDPIISPIARALLQLAFFRSNRKTQAANLELPRLSPPFTRLEAEMRALAHTCRYSMEPASASPEGLGFADISPVPDDRDLLRNVCAQRN